MKKSEFEQKVLNILLFYGKLHGVAVSVLRWNGSTKAISWGSSTTSTIASSHSGLTFASAFGNLGDTISDCNNSFKITSNEHVTKINIDIFQESFSWYVGDFLPRTYKIDSNDLQKFDDDVKKYYEWIIA